MLPKLLQIYQGKEYVNRELNIPMVVGKRGIKKVLSHLPDAKPAMAMAKLPELLESATWVADVNAKRIRITDQAWRYMKASLILADKAYTAEIKIREDKQR